MDNICPELVWQMFLKRNFEVLMNDIKQIFVYVNPTVKLCSKYCEYLFFKERIFSAEFQNSLSLYSIFMHFCFCKRKCDMDSKKSIVNYVQKL